MTDHQSPSLTFRVGHGGRRGNGSRSDEHTRRLLVCQRKKNQATVEIRFTPDDMPTFGKATAQTLLKAQVPAYVVRAVEACKNEDELYERLEAMPDDIQYQALAALTGMAYDPVSERDAPSVSVDTVPAAKVLSNTVDSLHAPLPAPRAWQRPDSPTVELTEEQQAIVQHDTGPALVFAVAGAGKSTALVHRIERLVREGVASPRHILATSFSRASIGDLTRALARWPHCAQVKPATLHSTGLRLMRLAQRKGLLPDLQLRDNDDAPGIDRIILSRAVRQARADYADYVPDLEALDQDDFLSYISVCKGNLRYADLERAELPEEGRRVATQAQPPLSFPWYLDLYRRYERERLKEGWITFDDMLMTGWECLACSPEVAAEARGRFHSVLVDEFQDVNLAQSEMLDQLTQPHRNYMVIGDDDQTIYEWRGADPRFILEFERRYGAKKYLIRDNFRCRASHLALANRVIEHNQRREPKRLSLTRGFDGGTHVHQEGSQAEQGLHIVSLIQQAIQDRQTVQDMAVLVRMYSQTPHIESALIDASIPYKIVGNVPFYQRTEVLTLIDYLRLGTVEQGLLARVPLDEGMISELGRLWNSVANRPKRYLSRDLGASIHERVVLYDIPLSKAVLLAAGQAERPTQRRALEELASVLKWLATTVDTQPASDVLTALDQRLGYQDHLRASSGFPETGLAKAANAEAFLMYARQKGTPKQLLAHLDRISQDAIGRERDDAECLKIMTVHRAKGLEWQTVFIPDCNHGTVPFTATVVGGQMLATVQAATSESAADKPSSFFEEERRLFYVAITRAKHDLHLHMLKHLPPSQFLVEAEWEQTLAEVDAVKAALRRPLSVWRTMDALALARHTHTHHFDRYFQRWWEAGESRTLIAGRMRAFYQEVARGGWHKSLGLDAEHSAVWDGIETTTATDGHENSTIFADLPLIVGNKRG